MLSKTVALPEGERAGAFQREPIYQGAGAGLPEGAGAGLLPQNWGLGGRCPAQEDPSLPRRLASLFGIPGAGDLYQGVAEGRTVPDVTEAIAGQGVGPSPLVEPVPEGHRDGAGADPLAQLNP